MGPRWAADPCMKKIPAILLNSYICTLLAVVFERFSEQRTMNTPPPGSTDPRAKILAKIKTQTT